MKTLVLLSLSLSLIVYIIGFIGCISTNDKRSLTTLIPLTVINIIALVCGILSKFN
jgi:hypothetical protein